MPVSSPPPHPPNNVEGEAWQDKRCFPLPLSDTFLFNIVNGGVWAGRACNALGLTRQNRVTIVNRKNEFSRAKQGNLEVLGLVETLRLA